LKFLKLQISIKFTNVSDGDVVLIDDLSAKFTECPIVREAPIDSAQRISKSAPKLVEIPYAVDKPTSIVTNLGTSIKKPLEKHRGGGESKDLGLHDRNALKRRLCREGDCMTIVHRSVPLSYDQLCIGRLGLLQCREKCLHDGAEGKSARCVRQHDYPFNKRCLCQLRRSPVHRVDGGNRRSERRRKQEKLPGQHSKTARLIDTTVPWNESTWWKRKSHSK
ncbi:hypothetical protein COOONC_18156, partial [Cooperia oncophora]